MNSKIQCRVSETRTITADNLPLACPTTANWNMHPRVFMKFTINAEGKSVAKCPYCGEKYQLVASSAATHNNERRG